MNRNRRQKRYGAAFIGVPTVAYEEPAVAGRTPWAGRPRTTELFSRQQCYACRTVIPAGEKAHWSKRFNGWRHADCEVAQTVAR